MAGLKKARLNKGNTNTLFDAYSEEEYEYDLAGNPYRYRVGSSDWNAVSSNKNNQTTQIDYASDAVLPIRGKAPADATLNISVDGALQNYTRPIGQEEFVFGLNAYSSTRKYHEVKAEAVETDNNTTPPTTIRTMQRGKAYIEATPENFVYDDNGNLASDGRHAYTWNNENRLIAVETNASAAGAGVEKEKFVYEYDWTGRKVKSEHYEYANNAWVLASTNKRYYDDYNLIYETTEYYDGTTPTEVKKYYYGTDLLGSVYGSAGTGGLRMMEIDGEDLFALNNQVGSVEALYGADADSASAVRAEYVYSAYGEVMMMSGDLADKNNIGYSTRYREGNTGLVSYTYRHYSPRLKKWLSKDPISEQGGINLYQMVDNDPINYWDMLGLSSGQDPCCKTGTRERSKICYIYIRVGHYDSIDKKLEHWKLTPCDRQAFVTCYQISANKTVAHENYYQNSNRTDDLLYPDDSEDGVKTMLKALTDEIAAAEKEASRMCEQKCCNKIVIKVLNLDMNGNKDASNWLNKHKDLKKDRETKCAN